MRLQHLQGRPGANRQAPRSGWEPDGISVSRGRDIHIDHCSVSWAVDENMAASGGRHGGPDATSGRVTISHSIIAEALGYATHRKGRHSKGLLVHYYVQEVAVVGNELRYGRDTYSDLTLVAYQADVYLKDSRVFNLDGEPMAQVQGDIKLLAEPPVWLAGLKPLPVLRLYRSVLKRAGDRPWDRDAVDVRIVRSVRKGAGRPAIGLQDFIPAEYR